MLSEEEAEIARCNQYFDVVDTVLNKIDRGFRNARIVQLSRDDWEILSAHIKGLGEVAADYVELRESLGI